MRTFVLLLGQLDERMSESWTKRCLPSQIINKPDITAMQTRHIFLVRTFSKTIIVKPTSGSETEERRVAFARSVRRTDEADQRPLQRSAPPKILRLLFARKPDTEKSQSGKRASHKQPLQTIGTRRRTTTNHNVERSTITAAAAATFRVDWSTGNRCPLWCFD